jgi:hypothetical protein
MAEPTRTPETEPAAAERPQPDALPWLEELPPRKIVTELDRYIVGQEPAKKAVAIAVRNRWRRTQAPDDIRDEILPNNIIMIGPTGVGKTEIARRLARLAGAPFLKVEASKFTEVGYVGRDVESMIRELVDVAINMVRTEREDDVYPTAEQRAEERLLDLLLPLSPPPPPRPHFPMPPPPLEPGARSRPQAGDRCSSCRPRATSRRRCRRPTPRRTSAAAAPARSCASSSRTGCSRSARWRSRCSSRASRCSR